MPSQRYSMLLTIVAVLMGAAAFFMIVGHRALDPTNIAWLANGDPAQHYLGWSFFRETPWSLPLGLNPGYGLELSNSILYSDSNPLLAFVFKPWADYLSHPFQYLGLWLLACFMLQAYFGWLLSGLMTASIWTRLAVTGFFIFSPPMINRVLGHLSLSGHFLLLAALYLAMARNLSHQAWRWLVLLSVAAMVHAYLLAMVGALWFGNLLDRVFVQKHPIKSSLSELVVTPLWVGAVCWLVGYFTVKSGVGTDGYGFFHWNLLSLFDSDNNSYLVPNLPGSGGDYEGYSFLGVGLLLLLPIALMQFIKHFRCYVARLSTRPFLLLALLVLALFAVSNIVGVGPWNLVLPINETFHKLARVFRASGRMFWPVFYGIVFCILYATIKDARRTRPLALGLWLLLILQAVDLSAGWLNIRHTFMVARSSVWSTDLIDPSWQTLSARYQSLRRLQPGNIPDHWQLFADYAAKHRMTTDSVYLARVDDGKAEQAQESARKMMSTGDYDQNALYILTDKALESAWSALDFERHTLALIDGFYVLAPSSNDSTGVVNGVLKLSRDRVANRQLFRFDERSADVRYLTHGWAGHEAWGTWTTGLEATVDLPMRRDTSHILVIDARAFINSRYPQQRINFYESEHLLKSVTLVNVDSNLIQLEIPESNARDRGEALLHLTIKTPDAISPKVVGFSSDERQLGLGLKNISVY